MKKKILKIISYFLKSKDYQVGQSVRIKKEHRMFHWESGTASTGVIERITNSTVIVRTKNGSYAMAKWLFEEQWEVESENKKQ